MPPPLTLYLVQRLGAAQYGEGLSYNEDMEKNVKKQGLCTFCAVAAALLITILLPYFWKVPPDNERAVSFSNLAGFFLIISPAVIVSLSTKASLDNLGFKGKIAASNLFGAVVAAVTFFIVPHIVPGISLDGAGIYSVIGCLTPAVAEEFLFRGFMQGNISPWLGKWKALLITVVAFAFFHFPRHILSGNKDLWGALMSCVLILPAALILGLARLLFGNIYAGVWLHFTWNIGLLFV
jgi:membrane protease YdiL (CAAX protease family)